MAGRDGARGFVESREDDKDGPYDHRTAPARPPPGANARQSCDRNGAVRISIKRLPADRCFHRS